MRRASLSKKPQDPPTYPATSAPCDLLKDHYELSQRIGWRLRKKCRRPDQDEYVQDSLIHSRPGASALLWGGVLEREVSQVKGSPPVDRFLEVGGI